MAQPLALLERPLEQTVIDPHNAVILRQHLVLAALEAPLRLPPHAADPHPPQPTTTLPPPGATTSASTRDTADAADACECEEGRQTSATVKRDTADAADATPLVSELEPQLGDWASWKDAAGPDF